MMVKKVANKLRASGQIQDKDRYITISEAKKQMVAMLEELQTELKELPKARFYETNEFGEATGCIDYPAISKNALDLIQEKINDIKETRDATYRC